MTIEHIILYINTTITNISLFTVRAVLEYYTRSILTVLISGMSIAYNYVVLILLFSI